MNDQLSVIPDQGAFGGNVETFEHAQRVAIMLSKSELVPKKYQGNIQNTMIALELAHRIKSSPLMVMQHLNIIQGKPSWSSTFLISAINQSGRYEPMKYEMKGKGETLSCFAWAIEKSTNEKLVGPEVTMAMATAEGWTTKEGSKWKTMPEVMIRYRAAAFFSRLYCPELTMGMQTAEEVTDISYVPVDFEAEHAELTKLYDLKKEALNESERKNADRILSKKETNSYSKLKTLLNSK